MRGRKRNASPSNQRPFVSSAHINIKNIQNIQNITITTTEKGVIQPSSSIPWVEKYRPSHFQDIVLDPLNREIFQNILNKNYFPHLLFYGPPGTGKTTTIINLINEFQAKYYRVNKSTVIHLNASDERGIDIIRNQIHQFAKSMNLFESGLKFVILDEVDYMTKNAQQALKYILQTSTYNVRFCLICNYITKMDESLKNEFLCIRFNQLPKQDIFKFMKNICQKEELNLTDETLDTIQEMYQSDIRSMINFVQMEGTRVQSIYTPFHMDVLKDIHSKITDPSSTFQEFDHFLHEISIRYNMEKRSLIQKYFNYLIRDGVIPMTNDPTKSDLHHRPKIQAVTDRPDSGPIQQLSTVLDNMQVIMHRPDIPIDVHIEYLYRMHHRPSILEN